MSSLQPVRAESLSAQVAESIRGAIFSGELKPGQVLRELGLAKNMNVSQATVREALSQLEHYGLVVRTPNRSTSVTSLSADELRNRASVWLTLESKVLERAIPNASALIPELSASLPENSSEDAVSATRHFHSRLWEATGNPILIRILDQLTTPLFAFCRMDADATREMTGRCSKILEGIRTGDLHSAQKALEDQVDSIQRANIQEVSEPELREVGAAV